MKITLSAIVALVLITLVAQGGMIDTSQPSDLTLSTIQSLGGDPALLTVNRSVPQYFTYEVTPTGGLSSHRFEIDVDTPLPEPVEMWGLVFGKLSQVSFHLGLGSGADFVPFFPPPTLSTAPRTFQGAEFDITTTTGTFGRVSSSPIRNSLAWRGSTFDTEHHFGFTMYVPDSPTQFTMRAQANHQYIPEPSSIVLAAIALGALLICRREQRNG